MPTIAELAHPEPIFFDIDIYPIQLSCATANGCVTAVADQELFIKVELDEDSDPLEYEAYVISKLDSLSGIDHTFVMEFKDFGLVKVRKQHIVEDGIGKTSPCLVTKYIENVNFEKWILAMKVQLKNNSQHYTYTCLILNQIMQRMNKLHEECGFIHNDLHIGNILLTSVDNKNNVPVLIDYGRSSTSEIVKRNVRTRFSMRVQDHLAHTEYIKMPGRNVLCNPWTDFAGLLIYMVSENLISFKSIKCVNNDIVVETTYEDIEDAHIFEELNEGVKHLWNLVVTYASYIDQRPTMSGTIVLPVENLMGSNYDENPFFTSGILMPSFWKDDSFVELFKSTVYKGSSLPVMAGGGSAKRGGAAALAMLSAQLSKVKIDTSLAPNIDNTRKLHLPKKLKNKKQQSGGGGKSAPDVEYGLDLAKKRMSCARCKMPVHDGSLFISRFVLSNDVRRRTHCFHTRCAVKHTKDGRMPPSKSCGVVVSPAVVEGPVPKKEWSMVVNDFSKAYNHKAIN